jgi:hypothetical protein
LFKDEFEPSIISKFNFEHEWEIVLINFKIDSNKYFNNLKTNNFYIKLKQIKALIFIIQN